jgi:hypothetical protein
VSRVSYSNHAPHLIRDLSTFGCVSYWIQTRSLSLPGRYLRRVHNLIQLLCQLPQVTVLFLV